MKQTEDIRFRNPFRNPLVTELIDNPQLYRQMFSDSILVGETLEVFQPTNAVLLGPQGAGKSMILNLIRYSVLAECVSVEGIPITRLKPVSPFFGISINLVRANFHTFGRRSISRTLKDGKFDEAVDGAGAADFIVHYLFAEYLRGLMFLLGAKGAHLARWMRVDPTTLGSTDFASRIARWEQWGGYYDSCKSLDDLLARCTRRLDAWRSFLNANTNEIPAEIWSSKAGTGEVLHEMGNALQELRSARKSLPLFIVIDQYEVLPELNPAFGTILQRIVNTYIKARDPVVFFKIGARNYDWGKELRVWGAESRIELQRDYVQINLVDLLMRGENPSGWLFPDFATDVAAKRLASEDLGSDPKLIRSIFGNWAAHGEARGYFKHSRRRNHVIGRLPDSVLRCIQDVCGKDPSPLDLRLASAWAEQQLKRQVAEMDVCKELRTRPWDKGWWKKERVQVALLQIASVANQRKRYYGWQPLLYLSGGNVTSFLLLCGEIWDFATKVGYNPTKDVPLPAQVQTEGIYVASEKWRDRDRNENIGGRFRYAALGRLGPAIRDALADDTAISNPGYSGFSLDEASLSSGEKADKVREFLNSAVNWAILEERPHTSKQPKDARRRKFYLHPLLSPAFGIPFMRVKEPLYVTVDDVYEWFFGANKVRFGARGGPKSKGSTREGRQMSLPFGDRK